MSSDRDAVEARIDELEQAGRFADALALLDELPPADGVDPRMHAAWLHTRAGHAERAQQLWSELRESHPQDPGIAYLHACALLEDGHDADALPLLGAALTEGIAVGSDAVLMARVADDRIAALRRLGARPEAVDHAARELFTRHATAVPWLARDQFLRVSDRWPDLGDDHRAYVAALERALRERDILSGRHPRLVALTVDEIERWAGEHGWSPAWPVTHDQVAAEVEHDDPARGRSWPPGRNDPCWCGSETKYKRCCGR